MDWGLATSALSTDQAVPSSRTSSDDWEIVPSPGSVAMAMNVFPTYTPTLNPEVLNQYTTRPLPPLPIRPSPSSYSFINHNLTKAKSEDGATTNPLNLSYRQQLKDQDVQAMLGSFEKDVSPLEAFLNDEQSHERLAMGLGRGPRVFCPSRSEIPRRDTPEAQEAIQGYGKDQHKEDELNGDEKGKGM